MNKLHKACTKKDIKKVGQLLASHTTDVTQKDMFDQTPLLIAVQRNCTAMVFQLLDHGGNDLNAKDAFGRSVLLNAVINKNHTVVTHLLARHSDPNVGDVRGKTPLIVASQQGDVCIVKRLLGDTRIVVDQEDEVNTTALWYASACGSVSILECLLKHGASVLTMNVDKKTPLIIATINGHVECVRLLVQNSSVNVNHKDAKGKTALDYACDRQHVDIFKILVEEGGAELGILQEDDGLTYLMRASDMGCKGIVECLLQQGPTRIEAMDRMCNTALYYACKHVEIFDLLLEHGAHPGHTSRYGKTILMRASEIGSLSAVKSVSNYMGSSFDVDAKDHFGNTALLYACMYGRGDVAKALIDAGANPLVVDLDDKTPLMLASFYGHDDVVTMLVSLEGKDVGIDLQDFQGLTALNKASLRGFSRVVKTLLSKGADARIEDIHDVTPLMYACRHSHSDVVHSLVEVSEVNAQDDAMQTAMYYACKHDSVECVRSLLLRHDTDACLADDKGRSPLMIASRKGNHMIVELLCKNMDGNGMNMQDASGQTALFHATDVAHSDIAVLLLRCGADPTKVCHNYLISPLIMACGSGDDVITDEILKGVGKYYVDFVDSRSMTALYHASTGGHFSCVQKLLRHNANVTISSATGVTPLLGATGRGYVGIVKDLVLSLSTTRAKKAYVNMSDMDLRTALHEAARVGYVDIAEFLVDHGASLTVSDVRGETPFTIACFRRQYVMVDMFLKKKGVEVGINHVNMEGKSALFYAISNRQTELIKLLFLHGADIGLLFDNGSIWQTGYPHHLPLRILKVLVDTCGLDIGRKNRQGYPPLLLLCLSYTNKIDEVNFLLSRGANPWIRSATGALPVAAARYNMIRDALQNAMMEDERFLLLEKTSVLKNMYVHMDRVSDEMKTRESKKQRRLVEAPTVLKQRLERCSPLPEITLNSSSSSSSLISGVVTEIVENRRLNDDVLRELHAMMKTPWE